MLAEKKTLSIAELEAQSAMELPDREMMLVTIVITNVLNNLSVDIDVKNNNVALQICAVVSALNNILVIGNPGDTTAVAVLTCEIEQNQGGN